MCEDCRAEAGDDIYNAINAFTDEWPEAASGPGHIVLDDFNVEPGHIRWCLGLILGEYQRRGLVGAPQHSDEADGVSALLTGKLDGRPDLYVDCELEELQATEVFLRERLLPLSLVYDDA